jgi:hypothetical protein
MHIDFAQSLRLELKRTSDRQVRLSLHNPLEDGQSVLETVIELEQLEQFVRVQGGSANRDSLLDLMRREQWTSANHREKPLGIDQSSDGRH